MQFFEERRVVLRRGAVGEYRQLVLESLWPALVEAGAQPLCLLTGLIGVVPEDTYLYVGFTDAEAWQRGQSLITGISLPGATVDGPQRRRAELIEEERVRLLIPSPQRPLPELALEDRRKVYGLRRWWIRPETWPEFEERTHAGVWPAFDAMGHYSIGHFRDAATTDPLEVTNIAGYHSVAHWEATRTPAAPANDVPAELLQRWREVGSKRQALVLRSFVCLMTAHWPD